MAENSKIQWTTHTFNPWRGCTKVSAGCANCYAETMSGRNPRTLGVWGPSGTRVVASEAMWREPLKWDREAKAAGERHRVFCASLADVFEDWKGPMVNSKGEEQFNGRSQATMQDVRVRLFCLIGDTPNLDWLVLTKRPQNIAPVFDDLMTREPFIVHDATAGPRQERWTNWKEIGVSPAKMWPNLWLGTSVENQATADERIPHLLKIPAAVRFLSCEPLLGPVNVSRWLVIDWQCSWCSGYFSGKYQKICPGCGKNSYWTGSHAFNARGLPKREVFPRQEGRGIDWVIVGGESGHDARTFRTEWAINIIKQCKAAGVPVFMKQLGENATTTLPEWEDWPGHTGPNSPVQFSGDGFGNYTVLGLKDKKGGDPSEWPLALRVREFPNTQKEATL